MIIFLIAILSLAMGSFATCASYRLGEKKSLLTPSKCIECNTKLRVRNLIPLLSWLWQRGKCGNCHQKISARYPLIELFFLVTFLALYFILGQQANLHYALLCLLATTLIIIAIVDIEKYFIPNSLQIALAILSASLVFLDAGNVELLRHIGAAIFYCAFGLLLYFLFYFTSHVEAIGTDDIKFLAVAGLLLGINKFLVFILIVGILGIIFGIIWEKVKKDETFPFAPALCVSMLASYIIDEKFNVVNLIGSVLFEVK